MTVNLRVLAALAAILLLTYLVYFPGLSAGFLFDDFVNLDAIGATGPVDNWTTFFRYVTSGTADPTGRPLSLLTFLIDARDWPAQARPFLHTNLVLHMVNGGLLFMLIRKLGTLVDGPGPRTDAAALLASGLWLLHPLLVSTTLYAVQREAMLPGTFVLLGLLGYLHGRSLPSGAGWFRQTTWMTLGIVGGTVLATLCKANGLLLPLLAWVLEATLLSRLAGVIRQPRYFPQTRFLLLTLPSLLLLAYLLTSLRSPNELIPYRGWSVAQRLLTEARILVDYLQLLVVPRSVSTGLYNDAYVVSTSLLLPGSTLSCVIAMLALPIGAWLARSRYPVFAAAILFFFGGHLLESTAVPLELYFEHRNYIPAMLFFWPISRALCNWNVDVRWRATVGVALLALFAFTTFQRATYWGNPQLQAALWVAQNPGSSRAQATVAMLDTSAGRADVAMRRLGPIWRARPNDLQLAFNYINSSCAIGSLAAEDANLLNRSLQVSDSGLRLIYGWLGNAIEAAAAKSCAGLTLDETERWLEAVSKNPSFLEAGALEQEVEPLRALIAMHRGRPAEALRHYDNALAAFTTPDVAARQASSLARRGHYREALAHLDTYERLESRVPPPGRGMPWLHREVLDWQGYWPREMRILREKLAAEIRLASGDPSP